MICLACGRKVSQRYGFGDKRSHFKGCPAVYGVNSVVTDRRIIRKEVTSNGRSG